MPRRGIDETILLNGSKKDLKSVRSTPANPRLSQVVVRRRLLRAFEAAVDDSFEMTGTEAWKIVRAIAGAREDKPFESVDDEFTKGVLAIVRMLFGKMGRRMVANEAKKIKTEEELIKAINQMRRNAYTLPSDMRKALKKFAEALPRRGGPGRKPILSPDEERLACEQVLVFIRQGSGIKDSLKRTAEISPNVLGKPVGTRTLQKVWKRRNTFVKTD